MSQASNATVAGVACRDNSFQPHAGPSCRGGFDFSLLFEETIFTIPLQCILLIVFPFRIFQLLRKDIQVGASILRPLKITFLLALIVLQNGLLILWGNSFGDKFTHTRFSTTTAALVFGATIAALPLSWLEHDRSKRPSFILSMYFFFSVLLDLPRTRTLWLLGDRPIIPILQTSSLAVRIVLFTLESTNKRGALLKSDNLSYEVTSSTISRSLFHWLMPLFRAGFRRNLVLDDLYPLDATMEAKPLHTMLRKKWERTMNKSAPGLLAWVWLKTFRLNMLGAVFPRLCLTGFTFAQPFLMKQAIVHVNDAAYGSHPALDNQGYGLIGAFFLTYAGIALATGQYNWRVRRSMTKMRGSVIAMIYEKSLRLDIASQNGSPQGALTLVGNDVENIGQGMDRMHELWAAPLEMSIAIYLLNRELGVACAMPVALAFFVLIATAYMAVLIGKAQTSWIGASESRITATSKTLGSIKWLKISGLSDMAFAIIRRLRKQEINVSRRYRFLFSVTMAILAMIPIWSPILTFSTWAAVAKSGGGGGLGLGHLFAAYSIVVLLISPLINMIVALPLLGVAMASFQRIQNYLNEEERVDKRVEAMDEKGCLVIQSGASSDGDSVTEAGRFGDEHVGTVAILDGDSIASISGTFSWTRDAAPVLDVKNLRFRKGAFTFIVGPVGCGKSTLLKALLGELSNFQGTVMTNIDGGTTFSDQIPWIPNDTVRNIILGDSPYHQEWYETVTRVCCLEQDFHNWPEGEDTIAGTNGISMSGGQKQRLSIARSVYSRRQLLIFDDCLSGLDASTARAVFEGLFGTQGLLRGGDSTVIASSSDLSRLRYADEIILLDANGQVKEHGSPEKLKKLLKISLQSELQPNQKDLASPATRPLKPVKEEFDPQKDSSRRLGDKGMYGFYASASGRTTLGILIVSMAAYGFCNTFHTQWLGWWGEAGQDSLNHLDKWIGVYVVLGVSAMAAIACGLYQIFIQIIDRSGTVFHDLLLDTVSRAPLSFHSTTDSGVTVNRFSQDIRLIDMELPSAAFGVATTLATALAQFVLVAVTSKYMAACLPLLLLTLYLTQLFYLRTSRQVRLLDIEHKAPLYSTLIETFSGLPTIRAYGWERMYEKKYMLLIDRAQRPAYLLTCLQCWLNLVADLFVLFLAVVFVAFATQLAKQIGPRNVGVGLSNVLGFSISLKSLITFWVTLEISLGAVARIHSFVRDMKLEGSDEPPSHDVLEPGNWPSRGHVELNNLVASYPQSGPIINGVSMTINPGEKVAICGRTGSGKSSLTLSLLRLMDIDMGSITIDGVDITTLPHEFVRNRLVALPQEAYVFDGTLRLNVDPSQTLPDSRIQEVLERVQLWKKVTHRGGLDVVIGEDFFSPGEAQLLVFARAMLRKSKILILDEFTSSLDEETSAIVDKVLKTWFDGWTILSIAHKLEAVLDYDKIAVFDAGRLMEFDSPQQLLQKESMFRSLYETALQRKMEMQKQEQQHQEEQEVLERQVVVETEHESTNAAKRVEEAKY
ncbi:hypothetical protein S40293_01213 [Stachybotrys chartarum IBT 40293]|nr:hypothetical protein S40293_01213 [Stachybotrys chartarum IBT 40293]